jgi:hypothetical protein
VRELRTPRSPGTRLEHEPHRSLAVVGLFLVFLVIEEVVVDLQVHPVRKKRGGMSARTMMRM